MDGTGTVAHASLKASIDCIVYKNCKQTSLDDWENKWEGKILGLDEWKWQRHNISKYLGIIMK